MKLCFLWNANTTQTFRQWMLKMSQGSIQISKPTQKFVHFKNTPPGEVLLLTFCSFSNGFYLKSISWSLLKAKKSKCSWLNDYKSWKNWCVLPISLCFNLAGLKAHLPACLWQLLWRGMEYKSPKLKNLITTDSRQRLFIWGNKEMELVVFNLWLQLGVEIWSCH